MMQQARAPVDASLFQWRTWQSDSDLALRKDILTRIYNHFRHKAGGKENARLLQYARRVEEELYRRAPSMAHYQDATTLTSRLSEVIKTFNRKTTQNGAAQPARQAAVTSMPDNIFRSGTVAAGPVTNARAPAPGPTMIPAPSVSQPNPARGAHVDASNTPSMMATPGLDSMAAQRPASANPWGPMGPENGWAQRQPGAGPMQGHNMMGMGAPPQMAGHGMNGSVTEAPVPHIVNHSGPVAVQQSSDAQAERLQRQQRLLMFLRHCAKCQVTNCPYGPNCETGKQLWQHITNCRDHQCAYPRCVHARDLLRHYQRCRRHDCPICAPIKRAGMDGSGRALAPAGGQPQNGAVPHDANSNGASGMVAPDSTVQTNGAMASAPSTSTMSNMQSRGRTRMRDEAPQEVKEEEAHNHKRSKQHLDHIKSKLGASLLETFDVDQLKEHVHSCQTEMEAFNLKAKGELVPEADMCTICKAKTALFFEPTPKECAACHCRIKKQQHYYQSQTPQAIWCAPCFQGAGETIRMGASTIKKDTVSSAAKRRNAEKQAEDWVCCDGCNRWVHMLCGLFNKGSNKEDTKFLCPWCLQDQQHAGTWTPIKKRPQSMLSAEELPRTDLSDHMENYLSLKLEEEYKQRKTAANGGPVPPMVTGLTVRAVNITRKETEVKPKYFEAFHNTHEYPQRFPFTQKVILVFQQIEGVDVLIFVVYVQEYGDDAAAPNRNTVYLAYLDSVKHFRPEEKDAGGTALRTMVYHEVLLAYIDRAAKLGMNSIYIWSCPPLAGDDYVLYCHPPKQKNPKADKLRDWYHSLCEKGINRDLMVMRSTIFDRFMAGGKHNAMMEPSTTMLPYFDGDYWPGDAENQLAEMERGVATGQSGKKGTKARQNGGKGKRMNMPLTTDGQLGQRLAESSLGSHQGNMMNDFIIAHLRTPCSMCPNYCDKVTYVLNKDRAQLPKPENRGKSFDGIQLAVDGAERCDIPKYFACCSACFQAAQKAERQGDQPKLPKQVSTNDLEPQACKPLGKTIEDKDQLMDCDIFDARTSFLSLCQDQEMMSTTCTNCSAEVPANQGWRCKECADYELCSTCYQAGHGRRHPHPLMRPTVDNHFQQALTQEQRRMRADTLRRTMVLLEHAAVCVDPNCQSKSCHKVKQLHAHSKQCNKRMTGNCNFCRHLWCLLGLHAKRCTKDNCPVPRCNELRKVRRQQASQADEDRRKRYFQSQQRQL